MKNRASRNRFDAYRLDSTCAVASFARSVQRQLFLPVGDNYFSPLPLVNEGRDGE